MHLYNDSLLFEKQDKNVNVALIIFSVLVNEYAKNTTWKTKTHIPGFLL